MPTTFRTPGLVPTEHEFSVPLDHAAPDGADHPYVELAFSEETAARTRGLRAWLTSEYDHNGLRADDARVPGRLIDLARGRA